MLSVIQYTMPIKVLYYVKCINIHKHIAKNTGEGNGFIVGCQRFVAFLVGSGESSE